MTKKKKENLDDLYILAANMGELEKVQKYIEQDNSLMFVCDKFGKTTLMIAINNNYEAMIKYFIELINYPLLRTVKMYNCYYTAADFATARGDVITAKLINDKIQQINQSISLACNIVENGNISEFEELYSKNINIVQYIFNYEIEIGINLLHFAIILNKSEFAEFMIIRHYHRNLDQQSAYGNTAAHYAVQNNLTNLISLLETKGASFDIPNAENKTAAMLAEEKKGNIQPEDNIGKFVISIQAPNNEMGDSGWRKTI